MNRARIVVDSDSKVALIISVKPILVGFTVVVNCINVSWCLVRIYYVIVVQ